MESKAKDYTISELMAVRAAREIHDGEVVFVGIGVPLAAGLLAKQTTAPNAILVFESGYVDGDPPGMASTVGDTILGRNCTYATTLWRVFYDQQRGFIDLGILGGAQIDKYGNLNTTFVKRGDGSVIRLPGSGGGNDIASCAKRTVLMMRLEKRRFVNKLDYLTSVGHYKGGNSRKEKLNLPGNGPETVITDKAVFKFDPITKEMYLYSIHPGISIEEVRDSVQWDLKIPEEVRQTEEPTKEEIELLRSLDPLDTIIGKSTKKKDLTFNEWFEETMKGWMKVISH